MRTDEKGNEVRCGTCVFAEPVPNNPQTCTCRLNPPQLVFLGFGQKSDIIHGKAQPQPIIQPACPGVNPLGDWCGHWTLGQPYPKVAE